MLHRLLAAHPRSFVRELRRIRFWITLAVLFVTADAVSSVWVFRYAQLRFQERLEAQSDRSKPAYASLVRITREEYNRYFSGQSPLNPRILEAVICKMLAVKPKVLVIDLATSAAVFSTGTKTDTEFVLPTTRTPLVFAYDLVYRYEHPAADDFRTPLRLTLGLGAALGGGPIGRNDVRKGLPIAVGDADWSVRRYERCFNISGMGSRPTLAYAAARAYLGLPGDGCDESDGIPGALEVGAVRAFDFGRRSIEDILPPPDEFNEQAWLGSDERRTCLSGEGPSSADATDAGSWGTNRVVILGGEYGNEDWHPTPFGLKPGVELVASSVEQQLADESHGLTEKLQKYGVKLALAFLVVFIHARLRPLPALVVTLVVMGGLVVFGSVIAFYVTAYRASTVPFLTGVLLEQLVNSAERHDG